MKTLIRMTAIMVAITAGCARKQSKPPDLVIDSTPKTNLQDTSVTVKNADARAGEELSIEGSFEVPDGSRKFPFVVVQVVGLDAEGNPVVANSATGNTESKNGTHYKYNVTLRGPTKAGTYEVKSFAGPNEAGSTQVVVGEAPPEPAAKPMP